MIYDLIAHNKVTNLSYELLIFRAGTAFSRTTSLWRTMKSTTAWAWSCTTSERVHSPYVACVWLLKRSCSPVLKPQALHRAAFALPLSSRLQSAKILLLPNHRLRCACAGAQDTAVVASHRLISPPTPTLFACNQTAIQPMFFALK